MNEPLALLAPSLSDRVTSLLRLVEYIRVVTEPERRLVYQLRYNCYLREGAIAPRPEPSLSDEFDNHTNTYVLGVRIERKLVASIRLHVLTAATPESPTMRAFGDVLTPLVRAGQTLIDPTRFVIDPAAATTTPELLYLTLRLPFIAAGYFKAEKALAAVRSEHMPFYNRVLRYTKVSAPREYLQLTKPLGLMMVNYAHENAAVSKRYPFFAPMLGEAERIFDE